MTGKTEIAGPAASAAARRCHGIARRVIRALVAASLALAVTSPMALAQHHQSTSSSGHPHSGGSWYGGRGWHGGYGGWGGWYGWYGWPYFAAPYYWGYPYAYPYYYGYPYPAAPYAEVPPAAAAPTAPAPASWYYCSNPQGYYPYVGQCQVAWQQVPTMPAPGSAPSR